MAECKQYIEWRSGYMNSRSNSEMLTMEKDGAWRLIMVRESTVDLLERTIHHEAEYHIWNVETGEHITGADYKTMYQTYKRRVDNGR